MRHSLVLVPLALLLAACDGATPRPDGPLALGIISGNHQRTVVGSDDLGQPVVGRLVRAKSGSITFRVVTPLHAQGGTVVTGSPVAGAVVCAAPLTEGGMRPWVPCTNTASDGTATFHFQAGTRAGHHLSEIRGTVEGQPAVFDTAEVDQLAGPYVGGYSYDSGFITTDTGVAVDTLAHDAYGNPLPYALQTIPDDTLLTVLGDTVGTVAARTLRWYPEEMRAAGVWTRVYGSLLLRTQAGVVDTVQYEMHPGMTTLRLLLHR